MKRDSRKRLVDIQDAIQKIESFLSHVDNYFEYVENQLVKSAVERQLGILGEAINKLGTEEPEIEIAHVRQIVGLRNRIIHAYDALDDETIWGICKRHIPLLKEEIQKLINEKR